MLPAPAAPPRKRPVNLTLSEHLVERARRHSSNLSATVEELLAQYVTRQEEALRERQRQVEASLAAWNALHDEHGSFADAHSTL